MTRYTIPDMSCDGCVGAITRAVRRVDAQAVVTADLAAHVVEIRSSAAPEILEAAIDDAGYAVKAA